MNCTNAKVSACKCNVCIYIHTLHLHALKRTPIPCKVNVTPVYYRVAPLHKQTSYSHVNTVLKEGSPVNFLREYCGMSWAEAFNELGIETAGSGTYKNPGNWMISRHHTAWMISRHHTAWIAHAESAIYMAEKVRWKDRGREALNYLYQRGFTDETIKAARLGYIPTDNNGKWIKQKVEEWGLPENPEQPYVYLFEGILIPYFVGGRPWKLEVRRLTNVDPNHRLSQIRGSADCFYNFDAIQHGNPVILVESALDALSGMQACNGEAVFLATGGTKKLYNNASWRNVLRWASCVLLSFDNDQPYNNGVRDGDACAHAWEEYITHSRRWRPWAHDVNDMLTQGKYDIRTWVREGLKFYQSLQKTPLPLQGERVLDMPEIADKLASIIPCSEIEVLPTQDAYKLPEPAPNKFNTWPPKHEDFWQKLERNLGADHKMTPTPRSAYWYLKGYEDQPIPSIYRKHINDNKR